MQPNTILLPGITADNGLPYRQLVGSLIFLAKCTRPDISFAVSKLSQFLNSYDKDHWKAAKQVLRYLKGTSNLGIRYNPGRTLKLTGYSDSDYAGDKTERKSTSGQVFFLGKQLISWTSRKQPCVAMSSTEAEYIALASAAREAIWLRRFLNELGYHQDQPTTIFVDNQSTIKLAKNPELHSRTKHIDVRYHYTRTLVEAGEIQVEYTPTTSQKADGLTKALMKSKNGAMNED
ncbi:unnamed protein product, partial [Allacma fusca]